MRLIYKQLGKYIVVGAVSNGLAYCLYLGIVFFGASPILSMSAVYIIVSSISFAANRSWTFQSEAHLSRSGLRYIASQFCGYATNLLLLTVLHYALGVPHQISQLVGVVVVAIQLFILNRYYVFS